MELCASLRHPAHVAGRQLRTANFPEERRQLLAKLVGRGRRAAGFRSRRAFAEDAGVGKRSVDAVETFEPTVGEDVLEAIGRTLGRYLQDWDVDTPRAILEDGVEPACIPRNQIPTADMADAAPAVSTEPDPSPAERYPDLEPALRSVIGLLRKQGVPEEAIMRAALKVVEELEQNRSATDRDDPDTPRGQVG